MLINLIIKSKNKKSTFYLLNMFNKFIKNKRLTLKPNMSTTKHFSVLKSPHVNKTAQEQFFTNSFIINVKINSADILTFLIFLKNIQNNFCFDAFVKTKINIKNQNIKSLKLKNKKFTAKKLLLNLNCYGKIKFS